MPGLQIPAIYARVSTEEQAGGWSLDQQVTTCREWAERAGLAASDARIYVDVASASSMARPGLQLLLSERAQVGDVICYRLDRLTRCLHDWCHLREAFHCLQDQTQVTIRCTSQVFDLSRPDGRAMAAMMVVFAELEREAISQRTSDALARRRGRPNGYESIKPLIAELRRAGKSLREIAHAASIALGQDVAHSTVRYLLRKLDL